MEEILDLLGGWQDFSTTGLNVLADKAEDNGDSKMVGALRAIAQIPWPWGVPTQLSVDEDLFLAIRVRDGVLFRVDLDCPGDEWEPTLRFTSADGETYYLYSQEVFAQRARAFDGEWFEFV